MGFTAADVPFCGPSVLAHAANEGRAQELAHRVAGQLAAARASFDTTLLPPHTGVARALAMDGPVVLADVQDNPGAGGTSDTTGLLRALIDLRAKGSVLGARWVGALGVFVGQPICRVGRLSERR